MVEGKASTVTAAVNHVPSVEQVELNYELLLHFFKYKFKFLFFLFFFYFYLFQ